MKQKILFVLIILLLPAMTVFAHPGRTDSKGGHWNHSTGEYHYHTGEYAGKSQSGSSSSKSSFKPPKESQTNSYYSKGVEDNIVMEDSPKKDKSKTIWSIIGDVAVWVVLTFISIFYAVSLLYPMAIAIRKIIVKFIKSIKK